MDYKLTCLKDPEDLRDYRFTTNFRSVSDLLKASPENIDYTNEMSPIKDQGRLGSCVSFATAAAKEWSEFKELQKRISEGAKRWEINRRTRWTDVSESWIYWNCKKIDPWPNEEGTSIRYAMKILKDLGVPPERLMKYNDDQTPDEPSIIASKRAFLGKIDSYWRVSNLLELKAALATQPLPIGVPVFEEFFTPKDGVISYPANPDNIYGGHAICVVGYDDKTELVKFKNSWGISWGQSGYGYLTYQYIQDFLWDAWTFTDLLVSTKREEKEMKK